MSPNTQTIGFGSPRKAGGRVWRPVVLGAVVVVCLASWSTATGVAATVEEIAAARKELAWKPRPVIFNNDGNDARRDDEPTRENFLRTRAVPMTKTRTSVLCYCTGIWGVFTHPSPVAELRDGRDRAQPEWAAFLSKDGGLDTLGTMVDISHKHNIECFWSLRMNDTHDAADPSMLSQWKKSHRDLLVGKPGVRYRGGAGRWSAADYAHAEVRDRVVAWIDDVARRYDVDGFELDFFRHLVYFKPQLEGKPATPEQCDQMTGLLRTIRERTDQQGARRGRPFLIAVRVPDSAGFSKALGLDVERWLREGLVDMLITTGYFRLCPWETSVALGHRYHVPVFASLDEPRLRGQDELQTIRRSIECYRARALEAWRAGVDGIYLFNYCEVHPDLQACNEVGDPEALMKMDKVYTTGTRRVRDANAYLPSAPKYVTRRPMLPEEPAALSVDKPAEVTLKVHDRIAEHGGTATLRLLVPGLGGADNLVVTLNGQTLAGGRVDGAWIEYTLDPAEVKTGENEFVFSLKNAEEKTPLLCDLLLWVRYG